MSRLDKLLLGAILLSLLLGALWSTRGPSFSRPDEAAHYLRAVEVAHGKWLNRSVDLGVDIPCKDYFTIAAKHAPMAFYRDVTGRLDFNDSSCRVRSVNTAGVYLPVSYLFLAPAERIGRALDWPIEDRLVLMRFVNFVGTALLLALAAWLVPRWRAPLLLIAFSPGLMLLRASVSADGMTAALALLFIAWVLRLLSKPRPPSVVQWACLFGLGLLLGGCKPVYGLITLCALLLAWRPDAAHVRLRTGGVALLAAAAVVGVSAAVLRAADPALLQLAYGADPAAQLAWMQQHPLAFPRAVVSGLGWRTFYEMWVPYGGAVDVRGLTIAWGLSLLLIGSCAIGPAAVPAGGRVFAAVLLVLLVLAIALPLYLTYTPPGYANVVGVQGRYLMPLAGLLVFALGGLVRPGPRQVGSMTEPLAERLAAPLSAFVPLAIGSWLALRGLS